MTDDYTPPTQETGTPAQPTTREDWVLQQLNNLSTEIGKNTMAVSQLEKSVGSISDDLKETNKIVTSIRILIGVATGALLVIGYLVNSRFDQIVNLIAK